MIVTPAGSSICSRARATSPPNPASRSQAFPPPATRMLRHCWLVAIGYHLQLVGEEEHVTTGIAHQVLPRVAVDRQPEVDLPVVVGEDALDGRRAPIQETGVEVGVRSGDDPHLPTTVEALAIDVDVVLPGPRVRQSRG